MAREPKPDFQRYMTALNRQEPDRVPLGDWAADPTLKAAFLGKKKIEGLSDELEFWYRAGFDYIPRFAGIAEWLFGSEARKVIDGDESERGWASEHEGVIRNWEEFEKYPWPSVDQFDFSKWDALDRMLPAGMKALGVLGRIYTSVWMYMGADVFFEALDSNEELIAALFEKIGSLQYATLLRLVEHPCIGGIVSHDDCAHNTGLLIHPRHLRKYMFPWYRKFGEVCRQKGLGFVFHSDGDCTEIMEDLIACGFHGFHPVQPNAMDIVETKKKWGDRLCLLGNINLDSTLTLGTPDEVRAEVYERIRTVGTGGGYMVASSNSITDYVPLENMKAMFEATFEYGQYPIGLEYRGYIDTAYRGGHKEEVCEKSASPSALNVNDYVAAFLSNDAERAVALARKDIEAGSSAHEVVNEGMVTAMAIVGEKFQTGEIYIPEMIIAARTMSATLARFKDLLAARDETASGVVVVGTVKNDLHDIGKNLVIMMLEGQGFTVHDLGIGVHESKFVEAVREIKPDILAMSALLTTTMAEMKVVMDVLRDAGLRDKVKIIVGGAPVTAEFAQRIGADGYAFDAPGAARKCKELLSQAK